MREKTLDGDKARPYQFLSEPQTAVSRFELDFSVLTSASSELGNRPGKRLITA
jgi:hypothetical protein